MQESVYCPRTFEWGNLFFFFCSHFQFHASISLVISFSLLFARFPCQPHFTFRASPPSLSLCLAPFLPSSLIDNCRGCNCLLIVSVSGWKIQETCLHQSGDTSTNFCGDLTPEHLPGGFRTRGLPLHRRHPLTSQGVMCSGPGAVESSG